MTARAVEIPNKLFFRIGDVAELVGVKPYVLRYWETEFPIIAPQKSSSGQRVYRRVDVETILMIQRLLHVERYSIEGARKKIKELRKEGELSEFRKEAAEPVSAREMGLTTDPEQLMELGKELRELSKTPLTALFKD